MLMIVSASNAHTLMRRLQLTAEGPHLSEEQCLELPWIRMETSKFVLECPDSNCWIAETLTPLPQLGHRIFEYAS
jgi:hypothetical protein